MNGDPRLGKMKGKKKKNDPLKVVYISSPMKVKTSASRFRSLVQELTGKNSDISRYESRDVYQEIDSCDDQSLTKETSSCHYQTYSSLSRDDTPTSSDSLSAGFSPEIGDQFAGIFSLNSSFYDSLNLDVLGSFDELL